MLRDKGIGGEEVVVLTPGNEGTDVEVASDNPDSRRELKSGFSVGEVVLPRTKPTGLEQISIFD